MPHTNHLKKRKKKCKKDIRMMAQKAEGIIRNR